MASPIETLQNFIDTHSDHGWQLVTDTELLKFPSIADTHYEFDCPCNPLFHFTVYKTDNPERPAYHLKP